MTDLPNPYSVNPRKRLTDKQRLEMFLAHGGKCCLCGNQIDGVRERWIDEHELALWVGGGNEMENRGPAHETCAKSKTSKEATQRAKGRRFAEFHLGAKRSLTPMPGGKNSKWKRTFYRGWVRRDEE
jgi:5-methylcytosine-specific restriction protein A